jgi:Uma2 family endonuclease
MQIPINLSALGELDEEQFFALASSNELLRFEREADGTIVCSEPAGGYAGHRNANVTFELELWNRRAKLGYTFDSSTGFTLPDKSVRAPDASWIASARWEAVPEERKHRYAPICPDFVIELASPSDSLSQLWRKMRAYLSNGCRLGWLIAPDAGEAFVYRAGLSAGDAPERVAFRGGVLSGEDVLPGFILSLEDLP